MARIPLRTYDREIENLIDRGQIEEAIAHAKNVLRQYPKHIETYRLLGKAFLESQRYSEASDILQRVLSVIPDDFVSQLGMSIIREDEGNLDAAIWHMERAYEVQPFNRAVQDELRRLYGRRDGVEPPRVRLTRGSLVRMYAKGELYPQAIAETRAALAEDHQRIDLQALLARMYYLTGQKVEAAEIASSLIGKIPYCLEANRILMDILPGTTRAEEARTFQRRVFDLDPYAEFISPNAPSSEQVPDQSVMVERVDWQPSMQEGQSPEWAQSIGVKWEEKPEEALPDWLSTIGSETVSAGKDSQASPTDMVPDFLRDAGWRQASNSAEEMPPEEGFESTFAGAAENDTLASADIPDWLQAMAPQVQPEADEKNRLDWLDEILPPGATSAGQAANTITGLTDDAGQSLPALSTEPSLDWLTTASEQPMQTEDESTGLPEWMTQSFAQPTDHETAGEDQSPAWLAGTEDKTAAAGIPSQAGQEEDVPAWLRDFSAPAEESPAEAVWEAPVEPGESSPPGAMEWLQEPEPPAEAADVAQAATGTGELPAWLRDETPVQPSTPEVPAWLSSAEMDVEPSGTSGQEQDDLGWLAGLGAVAASGFEAAPQEPEKAIPGWSQVEPVPPAESQEPDEEALPAEMPDWLAALNPTEETSTVEPEGVQASDSLPEWLPVEEEMHSVIQPPQEAPTVESYTPPAGSNEVDAAMAWLEALAAKQGAEAESLKITSPEERSETPPDWIAGLAASAEETAEAVDAPASAEEIPAWLVESSADSVSPSTGTPEWLQEPETMMAEIDTRASEELAIPDVSPAEQVPDWLAEAQQTHADTGDADATVPEWTLEAQDVIDAPETPLEAKAAETLPADELPAWLLEASQETSAPSDESTDWLHELQTQETEAVNIESVEPSAAEAQPAEEIPDWLAELGVSDTQPVADYAAASSADSFEFTPDSVEQPEPNEVVSKVETSAPNMTDMDAALAWLEGLAAKQGADEETLKISKPEERGETPPSWLSEMIEPEAAVEPELSDEDLSIEDTQPVKVHPQVIESETLEPEWMQTEQTEGEPAPVESVSGIPDWLAGLEEEQPAAEAESMMESVSTAELASSDETQDIPPHLDSRQPAGEETPSFGADDVDAAMAWLEALAARQGADAESLKITEPDERTETPPAWIAELAAQDSPAEPASSFTGPTETIETVEIPYEPAAAEAGGASLDETPTVSEPEVPTEPEPVLPPIAQEVVPLSVPNAEPEIPDWLLNYEEEQKSKSQAWTIPAESVPPVGADESFNLWLQTKVPQSDEPVAEPPAAAEPVQAAWQRAEPPQAQPPVLTETAQGLAHARGLLARGEIDQAADQYTRLVQSGQAIEETIQDLREALYLHPVDISIWQALGEAYIRADRVQEALDAYTKAEELLR